MSRFPPAVRRLTLASLLLCLVGWAPGFAADESARVPSRDLDALIAQHLPQMPASPAVDDELFLRRSSLDLIGRPPTVEEQTAFATDAAPDKRAKWIDRLLESKAF